MGIATVLNILGVVFLGIAAFGGSLPRISCEAMGLFLIAFATFVLPLVH